MNDLLAEVLVRIRCHITDLHFFFILNNLVLQILLNIYDVISFDFGTRSFSTQPL